MRRRIVAAASACFLGGHEYEVFLRFIKERLGRSTIDVKLIAALDGSPHGGGERVLQTCKLKMMLKFNEAE